MTPGRTRFSLLALLALAVAAGVAGAASPSVAVRTLCGLGTLFFVAIFEVGQTHVAGQRAIGIWTIDPYFAARHGPWYFWPFALFNRALRQPPLSFTDKAVPVDELLAELDRHWRASGAAVEELETPRTTSSA
jgi:hypothetical protein